MSEVKKRPTGEYTGKVSIAHRLTSQTSKVILVPDESGEFSNDNADECVKRMKAAAAKLNADPEVKHETKVDIVTCAAHADAKKFVPKIMWSRYERTDEAGNKDHHPYVMEFDPLRYTTSRGGGQQKAKFTKLA